MLFADIGAEAEKWVGPVVATFGASLAALFAWLTARDKLRFNAKVVALEAKIAHLTEKTEACHQEREELKAELDEIREHLSHGSRQHKPLERRKRNDPPPGGADRRHPDPE